METQMPRIRKNQAKKMQSEFIFSERTDLPDESGREKSNIINFAQHVTTERKRQQSEVIKHVTSLVRHLKGI
jgi:hypothetical protein